MEKQIKKKRKMSKARKVVLIFCYTMLIPAAWEMIRYLIVNIGSILMAFTLGDIGSSPLTLSNFERLFTELSSPDSVLYSAFFNTMKYFLLGIAKIFISYLIAFFLFKKCAGYKFFRFFFFLPSVIAPVISVTIFMGIVEKYGPLWEIMKLVFNVEYEELSTNPATATNLILTYVALSGFGMNYLIMLGAMNRIPEEYFEAAALDGCSPVREFFSIISPLVWETLSTLLILHFTQIFMASGPILYFTEGAYNTFTLSFWIFNEVRGDAYNYSSAVGLFFTVVALPIVFGIRYLMNKINPEVSY